MGPIVNRNMTLLILLGVILVVLFISLSFLLYGHC